MTRGFVSWNWYLGVDRTTLDTDIGFNGKRPVAFPFGPYGVVLSSQGSDNHTGLFLLWPRFHIGWKHSGEPGDKLTGTWGLTVRLTRPGSFYFARPHKIPKSRSASPPQPSTLPPHQNNHPTESTAQQTCRLTLRSPHNREPQGLSKHSLLGWRRQPAVTEGTSVSVTTEHRCRYNRYTTQKVLHDGWTEGA